MESQNHNLLVVSLESSCVTSVDNTGKVGHGIYTSSISDNMEAPLLQLTTPIHCLGAAVSRLPSNTTQMQPLQALSFDSTQQIHQQTSLLTNHAIYQPLTSDMIHLFTPSQPVLENNPYLSASSVTTLQIPSQSVPSQPTPSQSSNVPTTVETTTIDSIEKPQSVDVLPSTISCESAFPEDDYEYYEEIKSFLTSKQLPSNKSETYQSRLTERSKHYMVKNSKLYHNVNKPREVVMKKEFQLELLQYAHVLKDTGVHLGVRKVFNKLKTKYFWRGMYNDIVSFTKNCVECSEVADVGHQKKQDADDDCEDIVYDSPPAAGRSVGTQCADSWRVWRKVELQLHDSLPKTNSGNDKLLTITDPVSCWVVARAVPADLKEPLLAAFISQFLFETFCTFGFARCFLVLISSNMKDNISKELDSQRKNAAKLYLDSVIEEKESKCKWIVQLVYDLVDKYQEWDQNLNNFLFDHRTSNYWDDEMTTPFSCIFNHSPFLASTNVFGLETDENKENIVNDCNQSSTNNKAHNLMMKCPFCEEVFKSKTSLQIHEKRYCNILPLTAEKAKSLEGRRRKSEVVRVEGMSPSSTSADVPSTTSTSEVSSVCMDSAVSAVRALLAATKEERRKRGKYQKFPPDIQKQMAKYGTKYGYQKASRFFTAKLGREVSVRTIRTVMNIHSNFNPKVSEEIGRFAASFGIEQASKYFSEKLKRNVSLALVRKFKKTFLEKFPSSNRKFTNLKRNAQIVQQVKRCNSSKIILDRNLKEKIGHYASMHSVCETIEHFTPKLQRNIDKGLIKRCLNVYLNKVKADHQKNVSSNAKTHTSSQSEIVGIFSSKAPFDIATSESISRIASESQLAPELSMSIEKDLSSTHDGFSSQIVDNTPSQTTVIVTQTDHRPNSAQNPFNNTISHAVISPPRVTSTVCQHSQSVSSSSSHWVPDETRNEIEIQNNIFYDNRLNIDNVGCLNSNVTPTYDPFQAQFEKNNMQITVDSCTNESNNILKKVCLPFENKMVVSQDHDYSNINTNSIKMSSQNFYSNLKNNGDLSDSQDDSKSICDNDDVDSSSHGDFVLENERIEVNSDGTSSSSSSSSSGKRVRCKTKRKKGVGRTVKGDKKKRGSYTAYSPELRADIGRYAAEHGCFEARLHFQNVLGHMIPESTMRGLRDKYLKKQAHCKVTSLGYNQRGRPLRLGKYDQIVQQSLKQIIRSGERASAFVVIATAKQILSTAEPDLLEENGGPIKLNTTWAKSFLKRIGVHNNS